MSIPDAPAEEHFTNTTGDTIHPYTLFKRRNQPTTDTITTIEGPDSKTHRTVLIRNNDYEVWVKCRVEDDYPTHVTDGDRLTDEEFNAITLKHDAARNAPNIDSAALLDHLTSDNADVTRHAVTALTYVAREAPKTCTHTVPILTDLIKDHENTDISRWAVESLAHIAEVAPETVATAADAIQGEHDHDDHWARIKAREAHDAIHTAYTPAAQPGD